jgi:glycosyl hydrolase family 12
VVQRSGQGENRSRHVCGRAIATLSILVCIAAALAACGGGASTGARISLLPSTTAKSAAWKWTAACRVAPHGPTGCEPSGPEIGGHAQLAGNEWNLGPVPAAPAPAGAVSMALNTSGRLQLKGNLASAPPCTDHTCVAPEANTWVRGFPSVLYGIDQCNATTSPGQSAALRLPMRVGSIPTDLVGSATYESRAADVTYDVAYDLWLNASDTKAPCKSAGTLEVMVWTDYDAASLLPEAMKVGTVTIPFAANGSVESGNDAWSVYVSNVFQGGQTQPWGGTVWLVLDDAHRVSKGTVRVDLSSALGAVGTLLEQNYGWSDFRNNYWLDTIAFGMEYGPANADPYGDGPTRFSLDLRSYCLGVGVTLAADSC